VKILKDQAHACTAHLQKTTSLLYFCIEVLKESDPASFLQVGAALVSTSASIYSLNYYTCKFRDLAATSLNHPMPISAVLAVN